MREVQKEGKINKFRRNLGKMGHMKEKRREEGSREEDWWSFGAEKGCPRGVLQVSFKCSPTVRQVSFKAPGGMRGGPGAS